MSFGDSARGLSQNESMAFADNLRRLMTLRSMTAAELGPRVGVTPQAVSQWLRGQTHPVGKRLALVAGALGTTPGALVSESGGMSEEGETFQVGSPADEYHRLADVAEMLTTELATAGITLGQRRVILFAQQALAQASQMPRALPFEERARLAVEAKAQDIRRRLD